MFDDDKYRMPQEVLDMLKYWCYRGKNFVYLKHLSLGMSKEAAKKWTDEVWNTYATEAQKQREAHEN